MVSSILKSLPHSTQDAVPGHTRNAAFFSHAGHLWVTTRYASLALALSRHTDCLMVLGLVTVRGLMGPLFGMSSWLLIHHLLTYARAKSKT